MLEERISYFLVGVGSVAGLFVCQAAIAQPIVPAADGTNTQVLQNGSQFDIQGGQLSGNGDNLFHSFQEFGLNSGQTANFISQPQIQNILGRVRGGNASFIDGLLQVTGGQSNLYLINPAGILLGPNAQLNLPANFTATTATGIGFQNGLFDMTTNSFQELVGDPANFRFDAATVGDLVNAGNLGVEPGQTLSLIGGTVVNTGEVSAPEGNIIISAVAKPEESSAVIRLTPETGILGIEVQAETLSTTTSEALSLPQLITGGADVGSATGLAVELDDSGQEIAVISGSGITIPDEVGAAMISGEVEVAGTTGGTVQVTGDRIGLVAATIDASGANDGGDIFVGGNYQGQGPLPNAQQTYVAADASLNARSLVNGNAGEVIVWADEATQFYGTVDAQGGSQSGDGGFVEISGAENLTFNGEVWLEAANGTDGMLLLDPAIINIIDNSGGAANDGDLSGGGIFETEGTGQTFTISEQALENLTGSVTLEATDAIIVESLSDGRLLFQAGPTETVTFRTGASGIFNFEGSASVTATMLETSGGDLVFDVGAFDATFGSGGVGLERSFVSNGGNLTVMANTRLDGERTIFDSSSVTGDAGEITLQAGQRLTGIRSILATSTVGNGGDVNVSVLNPTANANSDILSIGRTDTSSDAGDAGDITFQSAVQIRDSTTAPNVNFVANAPTGQAGDITITVTEPNVLARSFGSVEALGDPSLPQADRGGNLTLTADEVNFFLVFDINVLDFVANPVALSGAATFTPTSTTQNISIGGTIDPADTLHISNTDLNTFSSFPNIDGGTNRVDGGVFININDTGTIRFDDLDPTSLATNITLTGGSNSVIEGPAQQTDYIILGTGSGIISGFEGTDGNNDPVFLRFANVGTIQAGDADDALVFLNDNATFDGNFDGGDGNNVLDFRGDATGTLGLPAGLVAGGVAGYTEALNVDLTQDPVDLTQDPAVTKVAGGPPIITGTVSNITGVFGGSGDDTILGDASDNRLAGGGGNDFIDGRGGNDFIDIEEDANFTLEASADPSVDNVLTIDDGATVETDEISNIEIARLTGGASDNTFTLGADSWDGPLVLIDGGEGSDTYDIGIDGIGTGSIIVGDTGTTGTDNLTVVGSAMDDTFALNVADSPNSGGFDPNPLSGVLILPDDAALLARLDEDFSTLPATNPNVMTLDNINILDTRRDDTGQLLSEPAYRVSRVSLASETAAFSGIEDLSFDGAGGSDTYEPTLGATTADSLLNITINDTGTGVGDVDRLAVSGTEQTNRFDITLATTVGESSQLRFETPAFNIGAEVIDFSGLEEVELDGRADTASGAVGDTYDIALGSPSAITLNINDTGAPNQGIDTLLITGTADADIFAIDSDSVDLMTTGETVPYAGIDALGLDAGAGFDTITVTDVVDADFFGVELDTGAGGGDITVNADVTADGTQMTNLTTAIPEGITFTTSNGSIDTTGGTLSTTPATPGAGAQITLNGTNTITTGALNTSGQASGGRITINSSNGSVDITGAIDTTSTAGPGGDVNVQAGNNINTAGVDTAGDTQGGAVNLNASIGSIDTSSGTISTTSNTGDGGNVNLQAMADVTTAAVTTSANLTSGDITVTTGMGDIDTSGAALTTASATGRGALISLEASDDITTGQLDASGVTRGGNVEVIGDGVVVTSIDTQATVGLGGNVSMGASQLQVTGSFINNDGINASIATIGATSNGTVTLAFSETGTFIVGDSTTNGTAAAITATSTILPIAVFSQDATQPGITLDFPGMPEIPDVPLEPTGLVFQGSITDLQGLIEDSQAQELPNACVPESNLTVEVEVMEQGREENEICLRD